MRKKLLNCLLGIVVIVFCINTVISVDYIKKAITSSQNLIDSNSLSMLYIFDKIDRLDKKIDKIRAFINDQEQKLQQRIELQPKIEALKKRTQELKLQQVNVVIVNKTIGALGSGVTLKYKDKYYILSAGHMIDNIDDEIILKENGQEICQLEIIKLDFKRNEIDYTKGTDLVLLQSKDKNIVPKIYTELADNEPILSEEVTIVGNPLGFEDIVSIGRVAIYNENFMYFRDSTYFGNSGGGIYNSNGQLVGIMSHIAPFYTLPNIPPFIIEGAVRLSVIKDFLKEFNNGE